MNLRERILSNTVVYQTFKRIVAPKGTLKRIVEEHFQASPGSRVLDLGCGFGDFAPFFSTNGEYLGIDSNESYVATARRNNRNSKAKFLVADLEDPVVTSVGPFDLIIMSGVLHHLSSPIVRSIGQQISNLLAVGGRFVAMEPVFDSEQRLSARLIIASDRGRFVRDSEGYCSLLQPSFQEISVTILSDALRIPYTHAVIQANH